MQEALAIVVGVLYAAGLYLMLRRSIVKILIGLALMGHAANLLIFTSGGLSRSGPPIIDPSVGPSAQAMADPLPQALILTAIVIGFGVLAFAVVLVHRVCETVGTDDVDTMRSTDT